MKIIKTIILLILIGISLFSKSQDQDQEFNFENSRDIVSKDLAFTSNYLNVLGYELLDIEPDSLYNIVTFNKCNDDTCYFVEVAVEKNSQSIKRLRYNIYSTNDLVDLRRLLIDSGYTSFGIDITDNYMKEIFFNMKDTTYAFFVDVYSITNSRISYIIDIAE